MTNIILRVPITTSNNLISSLPPVICMRVGALRICPRVSATMQMYNEDELYDNSGLDESCGKHKTR